MTTNKSYATPLSTLISRMQRWTSVYRNTEEQYLVQDLDEAIRNLRRVHKLPWALRKNTIRIFPDVLEYAAAIDHDDLAFIENQQSVYENKSRPYYTSIKEFYEDPTNRSMLATIWDNGNLYLGIKNKNIDASSAVVDDVSSITGYVVSGDSSSVALDTVIVEEVNVGYSLRTAVIYNTGSVIFDRTIPEIVSDVDYLKKYFFRKVYFTSVPTNIELKIGIDSSNYLYKNITAQFNGQPFKVNAWNLIGFDLNEASEFGTFTGTNFSYEGITFTGLTEDCTIYLGQSKLSSWELMDYWYYSVYNIITLGNTIANQEFFMDGSNIYSTDSELVAPAEYADVIMYDALMLSLTDIENTKILPIIQSRRDEAWDNLISDFPDLSPLIITNKWRFASQMDQLTPDERD